MTAWERIIAWLDANAPKAAENVNPPAKAADFAAVEKKLDIRFTKAERAAFGEHDGQGYEIPLIEDWTLLSLADIPEEWEATLPAGQNPDADAVVKPDPGVAKRWFHEAWVPFASDGAGNLLCLDHAPGKGGTEGQIVYVSGEDEKRPVVAQSIEAWLGAVADDMEAGRVALEGRRLLRKPG